MENAEDVQRAWTLADILDKCCNHAQASALAVTQASMARARTEGCP